MSALGASQNPLYVVEYRLPVPELPTTTVTTLPYRGLLPLEWYRLNRWLRQLHYAQHR